MGRTQSADDWRRLAGYGQTGPYSKNPGYDVNIEAEAGLMHITGEPTGPPVKVGVASQSRGAASGVGYRLG